MNRQLALPYTYVTPLDKIHEKLAEQGFAIVKEHALSDVFCDEAMDEVWLALEALITGPHDSKIRRCDKSTYSNYFKLRPSQSMMLQHFGFGQMPTVWKAREAAAPIFAHLWNVEPDQLITSMDAISFHIAPEKFSPPRGQFHRDELLGHTDQRLINSSGRCIQGFYNLGECGPEDGCLSVLEGSHKFHQDLRPKFYANIRDSHYLVADDWHPLSDDEMKYCIEEKGCRWRFVCPPKGSFVLWDSRTIHTGTEPRLPRSVIRDRLVYYICMLPKNATAFNGYKCDGIRETDVQARIKAFQEHRVTTHWPYPIDLFAKVPFSLSRYISTDQTRIPRLTVNEMSSLQLSLFGTNDKSLITHQTVRTSKLCVVL